MGYKRAGFKVIGNVEIDPKINNIYIRNNKPEYNYRMDLREFNKLEELPDALGKIDILDGSPPCTSFSTAGVRDRDWGKEKKFREGQVRQTLDDLFFVFLDTVEKLEPKIVVAENVTGMNVGKAKGHINLIAKRFKELGYALQIFELNSAYMDVPQARHRLFFIANRCGYPKLRLDFHYDLIPFSEVRDPRPGKKGTGQIATLLEKAKNTDKKMQDVLIRTTGEKKYYGQIILSDERVAQCITSGGMFFRLCDRTKLRDEDFRNVQTFPQDYDFMGENVQYVCGMSVPPNMMANVATEIWE